MSTSNTNPNSKGQTVAKGVKSTEKAQSTSEKSKKVSEKEIKAKVKKASSEKPETIRAVKYNYPEGASAEEKKKFRAEARRTLRSLVKQIKDATKSKDEAVKANVPKLEKELKAATKGYMLHPENKEEIPV